MAEALLIYLYVTTGKLAEWLLVGGLAGAALTGWVYIAAESGSEKELAEKALILFKRAFGVLVIGCLMNIFYPDKEDLVMIVGGAAAFNLAQTEEAAKLPENVLGAMNRFLESVEEASE